jgi:hypothetical protein
LPLAHQRLHLGFVFFGDCDQRSYLIVVMRGSGCQSVDDLGQTIQIVGEAIDLFCGWS